MSMSSPLAVSSLRRIEDEETLVTFIEYLLAKVKPSFPSSKHYLFDSLESISESAYSFEKYGCAIVFSKEIFGIDSMKMTHITLLALGSSQPMCKMKLNRQGYEFVPNYQGYCCMPVGAIPFDKINKFMKVFSHCHSLSSFHLPPYSPGYILAVCQDTLSFLNQDDLPAAYVAESHPYEDTKLPKNSLWELIKAVVNFQLESSEVSQ
jgi:hypothetical protein